MAVQIFTFFWLMTIFATVLGDPSSNADVYSEVDNRDVNTKTLNEVKHDIIDMEKECDLLEGNQFDVKETTYKLQLHASTIRFSDILDKWSNICQGKTRILEFFARDTIIIDEDFHNGGENLQFVVISPKIWVIGNRTINLTGADGGKHEELYAKNGGRGLPGDDGLNGLPGKPGGIFIGITQEIINGEMLHIYANGGEGGPGQHGGDGGLGKVPERPDWNNIDNNDKVILVETENSGFFSFLSPSCTYVLTKLTAGGNGGNGGKRGKGGNAGQIIWHHLKGNFEKHKPVPLQGLQGVHGVGGKGGKGNKKSVIVGSSCSHKKGLTAIPNRKVRLEIAASLKNGINGEIGESRKNIELPMEVKGFRDFAFVVNDYKNVVRPYLDESHTTEKLNIFYEKLINDKEIISKYGTLGLIDELKGLDTQFLNLTERMDLSPLYDNLRERIEKYVVHRVDSELDEDYAVALGYAYTNVLTRSSSLSENTMLIVDLQKYLDLIIDDLNMLKDNKVSYHFLYQSEGNSVYNIEEMMGEIEKIIEIQFKEELNKMNKLLKEILSNLIDNAMNIKNENRIRNYTLKSVKQQQVLFTILETIFESISVLIPGGKAAAAIASTSIEVGQNFLPEYSRDRTTEDMIDEARIFFWRDLEFLKNFKQDQFKILKKQIEFLNDEEKALESNRTSLPDELKRLEDQLKNWKHEVENGNGTKAAKMMGIIGNLEVFQAMKKLIYNKADEIEVQEKKMGTIKQIFKSVVNDTKNLKKYHDRIFAEFIPVFEMINRDLDPRNLGLFEPETPPEISRWEVQAALENVKLIVRQFTLESEVANEMNPLIKSLEDIMNLLINTYNRIRRFQQEYKLVAYTKRLSLDEYQNYHPNIEALKNPLLETRTRICKNLALILYGRMFNDFKQVAFPFIDAYGFDDLYKPAALDFHTHDKNSTRFFERILENIMKMIGKLKMNKESHIEGKWDDTFSEGEELLKEIYKWKNETHHEMISNLLDGHEVILSPDARILPAYAVKFKRIRVNLKAKDEKYQEALDEELKHLELRMTHEGNSYYTCGDKMYLVFHSPLSLAKTFNDENKNMVADKIARGDDLVSPFATWRVRISSLKKENVRFRKNPFSEFKNKVDLVLEVTAGNFLAESHQEICNEYKNLSEYYEEYVPLSNVSLIQI